MPRLCMLVGRQAAWWVIWQCVNMMCFKSSRSAGTLVAFGRQAAWRPGANVVGPCHQAAWWHEAVAVESLGGDCKGLGLCSARGLYMTCFCQASWQGHLWLSVVKLLGGRVQLLSDRVVELLGGTEQLPSSCSAVIARILGHVLPEA